MSNLTVIQINSREDLKYILDLLQTKIKNAEIIQLHNIDNFLETEIELSELLKQKAIPDYILYYFKDLSNSDIYKLSVETYHGQGGSLRKIN